MTPDSGARPIGWVSVEREVYYFKCARVGECDGMKASARIPLIVVATAAMFVVGCPLPYDYSGRGAGSSNTTDPSSPKVTEAVAFSYAEQGGSSGSIANGTSYTSGKTTTVTLSTATNNAVIYYTDDATTITSVNASDVKKINGSSGSITITRTSSPQSLTLHAVAIGPGMVPSTLSQATVTVSPYPIFSVTVSPASFSEDGGTAGTATFTITSSVSPAADISFTVTTGGSYTTADVVNTFPPSGTDIPLIMAAHTTTRTVAVTSQHDPLHVNRTVTLTVKPDSVTPPTAPAYSPGASATATIQDDASLGVTYDGNSPTSGSAPTDANFYFTGSTVTVLGNTGNLAKTSLGFAGWTMASDGTGTVYNAGDTFTMPSAAVTLYAKWMPAYTVTYSGNNNTGGTAPSDGNSYLAGATVTVQGNTGTLFRTGYAFGGWSSLPGGGTTYGATFTMGSVNTTLYAVWTPIPIRYVNAVTGNDSNPGTSGAPLKTITKALSVAANYSVIDVAPGTYDVTNGETFPLVLPTGVNLLGNIGGVGSGVLIQGGAEPPGISGFISAAVIMGKNSVLEGFTVTNSSGVDIPMGILFAAAFGSDNAVVRANTISGNGHDGIYVYGGSSGGAVDQNFFVINGSGDLVFVDYGGNGMVVSNNSFSALVELDTPGPDLGGGAAGSPGNNHFPGVNLTYFGTGGLVYARNNDWLGYPPTVGTWPGGYDVGLSPSSASTVDVTGYY